jgi:peroxiredoxin/predicted 2-oxoglutarate/Fe(II)-dependent dioxygenase YbiX
MSGPIPSGSYRRLEAGDPAPWFTQRTSGNPRFVFDTAAGRYVVLCFYSTASDATGRKAIDAVMAGRSRFDDRRACFFGVSLDPRDEQEKRVADSVPGIRFFLDFDGTVSALYGSTPVDSKPGKGPVGARRFSVVLDPTLRVLAVIPFDANGGIDRLFAFLDALPPPAHFAGVELQAPILLLPNVFEPEFCRKLIDLYETTGGEESGFMREVDGKTVMIADRGHKQRRDHVIEDQEIIEATRQRVRRRVAPEIMKVHQFNVTRMERYIVACYRADEGGHFNAHRDNTTKGTAHRRFAVSINLNAEFEGGEVSFPEYGPRSFKPPPGGAVVFSCSLLHAVSRVTSGQRYVFLPFLYDDAAAKLREANNQFLGEGVGGYKSGATAAKTNA